MRACVCECPLIVTLDCSKTATYWDGVGTAVAQAAYVMRHFFSLSLSSPSLSAYTLRKLDGAEMPGITGKRVCVFMLLPRLWMGKDEICMFDLSPELLCLSGVGRDVQNYIFSKTTSRWVA